MKSDVFERLSVLCGNGNTIRYKHLMIVGALALSGYTVAPFEEQICYLDKAGNGESMSSGLSGSQRLLLLLN